MKITGETLIPAPREAVWQALNDPVVLRQAIPGCESLEQTADNEFKATVTIFGACDVYREIAYRVQLLLHSHRVIL